MPRFRDRSRPITNGSSSASWTTVATGVATCGRPRAGAGPLDSGVAHPAQWRAGADGTWCERAFGRLIPLALDQPVIHVCWCEADAYARWAGKRLPTEAEWEKAAAWDLERGTARRHPWGDAPPTPERANLDQRAFSPAAVGAYPRGVSYFGCQQMLGDVWEWTASDFAAYPGFVAFPYPEYSEVHFGRGYKVLRGGSWATQPRSPATRSATGTCHSAARSSPASAVPGTPEALRAALGALRSSPSRTPRPRRARSTCRPIPAGRGRLGGRPCGRRRRPARGEHVGWTETAHVACRDAAAARPARPLASWRHGARRSRAWCSSRTTAPRSRRPRSTWRCASAARRCSAWRARRRARALRRVVRARRRSRRARPRGTATSSSRSTSIRGGTTPPSPRLARAGRVAVLDWKGGGARADHERAVASLPDALHRGSALGAGAVVARR